MSFFSTDLCCPVLTLLLIVGFVASLSSFFTIAPNRTRVSVTTFAGARSSNYALTPGSPNCPPGTIWEASGQVRSKYEFGCSSRLRIAHQPTLRYMNRAASVQRLLSVSALSTTSSMDLSSVAVLACLKPLPALVTVPTAPTGTHSITHTACTRVISSRSTALTVSAVPLVLPTTPALLPL